MTKCMYTYLIYDDNKQATPIKPYDLGLIEYVISIYPEIRSDIDINDAVHLINSSCTSNKELMNKLIELYNAKNPDKKLDPSAYHYVKLTTLKYENIYDMPKCEDYKSDENYEDEKKVNIMVPIIYKDDVLRDSTDYRENRENRPTIFELCGTDLFTLSCYLESETIYEKAGSVPGIIARKYQKDEAKKNFFTSLWYKMANMIQARFDSVTRNDNFPGEHFPRLRVDEYLFNTTFNDRCSKGTIFPRMIIDEMLFYEKVFDIYRRYGKKYEIGKTNIDPEVFDRLMTFSKTDLHNYKEISKNFPLYKKEPVKVETPQIEEVKDAVILKRTKPFDEKSVIKSEIQEQSLVNQANNDLDGNFTISDLKDPEIRSFIEEYTPSSDKKDDDVIEEMYEVKDEPQVAKTNEDIEAMIAVEREQQEFINRINSELDSYFTASDLEDSSIGEFITDYTPDSKSRG